MKVRYVMVVMFFASFSILTACNMFQDNMTDNVNYSPVRYDEKRYDFDNDGETDFMDTETDRQRAKMMDNDYFSPDGNYGDPDEADGVHEGDRRENQNFLEMNNDQPDYKRGEMKGKLN
ncbi:hypothetical protein ACFSCX_25460 [Bacillus salitolerans]|uniref:Lipoprotein n=1 Tax=Bacillus salitolerans TaxID=1437434 RepID=A0ABW4LXC6_9BACI